MENEQHHYELRSGSRSRSHTPMVPGRSLPEEVTEHHYDLRRRSRERSHTPGEVTSSRRSGSRSLTGSSSKMQEKNMETIEESKEGSIIESVTDNQSTKSEGSIISKKAERRSERQRVKRQIFVNGQSESKENTANQKIEQKRKSVTPHRILTSDYSSEEGDREDPPSRPGSAYEIYKQSGEWWNVFPKTDYTYSQTSQCRYEIAPGVLAMPNMSRRSIHSILDNSGNNFVSQSCSQISRRTTESGFSDGLDTVDLKDTGSLLHSSEDFSRMRTLDSARSTTYKKTHVEQYMSHKEVVYTDSGSPSLRQRYFSWFNTPSKYTDVYNTSQYDSDTEFDKTMTSSVARINQRWKIVQWFTYLTTFIAVWFSKIVEFFKFRTDRKRQYYDAQTYRYIQESKWSTLWKTVGRYSRNIYFFFARLFLFDTWLLSQFTGIRKWLQQKTPKIFWIGLISLLLLLGTYIAQEHFFTCVDTLRKVQYGVTETTYHIFNDITTNLTSLDYELFAKYIANLKDYTMHLLPSVNVSLPELPTIGWNITW